MRRKTLIVITLIAVMLFSSFLPVVEVFAAEDSATKMTFNTDLYNGLKAYFKEQGVSATYNDVEHTIGMSSSVLNSIETISLKEKGISNISGIEFFGNVKSLILSANNLTEKSNLEVLNSLANLSYLDLSSNNIKDVSAIEPLIMRLLALDTNAINLSSQSAKAVVDVEVDLEEQKTRETFSLPQILELAGIANKGEITNKGYLKAEWFVTGYSASSRNSASTYPYIVSSSIPNPVTADDNEFEIQVGYESTTGTYIPYEGLIKLEITIKDINPDSYINNPASKNILKDSIFTIYYIVHLADTDAVILKDRNLYFAVKDQLTKNQEINPNLESYKYESTSDGEIYYDLCDYTVSGSKATLSIDGTAIYEINGFNPEGGEASIRDLTTGEYYVLPYEAVDVSSPDNSGNVTTKRKIKVPHINTTCRNLYVDAYNEPQALVITDLNIVNKITSLILNDKRIYDLSGIEGFQGLESNLNVSYNYIDTLANIYALQKNKESRNGSLQELFNEKKSAMATTKSKVTAAYQKAEDAKKNVEKEIKSIEENIAKLATIADTASSEYTSTVKAIQEAIKRIYGDGRDENKGLIDGIDKAFTDPQEGLNANISEMYSRLAAMYRVFNKEYKLTTILTSELNYQTEEEYEAYLEKNKTLESAKAMTKDEISRIATLESADALSSLEKDLIVNAFGLALSDEQDKPISYALNELVKALEETGANRTSWVAMNAKFIEVGVYSSAANYCLIQRMNNTAPAGACYAEEYLKSVLENYSYEGINTELVKAIYEKIKLGKTSSDYTASLNNIFSNYLTKTLNYSGTILSACKGTYNPVNKLDKVVTNVSSGITEIGNYPNKVEFVETVNSKTSSSGIFFYEQLMSLANKFTAIDETSLYVNLPALKRIDIRNNEIETLGPTEVTMVSKDGTEVTSTETLASIKNLKELYAGHNFVSGDIACVDWNTLTSLKKLDLSYNFIRDIKPLEVLKNLKYLDVSDNLLGGSFNISIRKMEKLHDLILAGNQYTDISQILNDYEMITGGDFTSYFAREDTLNLDLSRQTLQINIKDIITKDEQANVKEIDLPPIFAQLEYIDAARTAFGTTSSKGSVQARGGKAYIPINEAGDYQAVVKVIAANGYPEEVSTSVGINTKCTINYTVSEDDSTNATDPEKIVKSVTISSDKTTVKAGETVNLSATVEGINLADSDKAVTWKVAGNSSSNTRISNDGMLAVAENETSSKLTVTATSVADSDVKATQVITVTRDTTPTDPTDPTTPEEPTYGYEVSSDGTEIMGISPNTNSSNFKTKLVNDSSYKVEVKREGNTISENEYVATGDIVVISKDGKAVASYELVVKGDVNGDGVADALDSSLIKAYRAKLEKLSGAYLKAADINNDGDVNIIDVRLLLYHRARIEGYIL